MRGFLIALAVVLSATRADAGPTCGGRDLWSPGAGQVLPTRPRLVYAREDHYTLRGHLPAEKHAMRVPSFTVTIDGTPAKFSVDHQRADEYVLFIVDVIDDRDGELVVSSGDGQAPVHYTIDRAWQAPKLVPTVGRYHDIAARMATVYLEGLSVGVAGPVVAFSGRWRRDTHDAWHAFQVPAIAVDGTMAARFGARDCTPPSIPLEWLERGIELELDAWLPDRSRVRVTDIPVPVALPPAVPAPASRRS